MKPLALATLLQELLHDWSGTVVVEKPDVLPIEYEIVRLDQLSEQLSERKVERFFLSVTGHPRNSLDLNYRDRTPGQHVMFDLGWVEESRKSIFYSIAIADRSKQPALALVARLRKAIGTVSKKGVSTCLKSGETRIMRNLFWTPDLQNWDLASYQAVVDDESKD